MYREELISDSIMMYKEFLLVELGNCGYKVTMIKATDEELKNEGIVCSNGTSYKDSVKYPWFSTSALCSTTKLTLMEIGDEVELDSDTLLIRVK